MRRRGEINWKMAVSENVKEQAALYTEPVQKLGHLRKEWWVGLSVSLLQFVGFL